MSNIVPSYKTIKKKSNKTIVGLRERYIPPTLINLIINFISHIYVYIQR